MALRALAAMAAVAACVLGAPALAQATTFTVSNPSGWEGGGVVFTITRSGDTSAAHTVGYSTQGQTAFANSDYWGTTGSVIFEAGETSKTVWVQTIDNADHEDDETFFLNVSAPTGTTVTNPNSRGVGTILDNDEPAPELSVSDATATEGGSLVFTVTRAGSTAAAVGVSYATADGTATSGADYTAASGSLAFAAGETAKSVTVATLLDAAAEPDETVLLTLSGATGGAAIADAQGVGTIGDPSAVYTVSNPTAVEGGGVVFAITRTGDTSAPQTVGYSTEGQTAFANSDYWGTSSSVTFEAGETSKSVWVQTIDDAAPEDDETFFLKVTVPSGAAVTNPNSRGVGTITDNDEENQAPTDISPDAASVAENAADGALVATLAATDPNSGDAATFSLTNSAGGRFAISAGGDLTVVNGSLLDYESATSHDVIVRVTDTGGATYDETISIAVTDVNEAPTALELIDVLTSIAENSPTSSRVRVADISVTDDALGTETLSLAGADAALFELEGTTLYLRAGVPLDYETKPSYAVTVQADDPSVGFAPDVQAVFTLAVTDAGEPSFSVADASVVEGGDLVFTVTKTGSTSQSLSVSWSTLNGTATAGMDFTAGSGTLTFASGETSKVVAVATIQDGAYEPSETVLFNLSAPTGGATIVDGQGVGAITDDDPENLAPTDISPNSATVVENAAIGTTVASLTVTDANPGDAAAATLTLVNSGGGLFSITTTGQLRVAGAIDYESTAPGHAITVRVRATDPGGLSREEDVVVTVSDVNENNAPTALADTFRRSVGTGPTDLDVLANDIEPDGQTLTITSVTDPAGAATAVVAQGGAAVTFTPAGTETATFSYAVSDGAGGTATASVSVEVGAATQKTYAYDNLGRLTRASYSGGAFVQYGYDAAGNRLLVTGDMPPTFSVSSGAQAVEGQGLVFTITKSGSASQPFSVAYATSNGTAVAGDDYTTKTGTLVFEPNEMSRTVEVTTLQNTTLEQPETVLLTLSSPSNGSTIAVGQASGVINDDDGGPVFSVNDPMVAEGGGLVFRITKSGSSALSHSVSYRTRLEGSTATAGADYMAVGTTTITFGPSDTYEDITVTTLSDTVFEGEETVVLELSSATGGATVGDSTGIGRIADNDPVPTFSVSGVSAEEGGTLKFEVTRTNASSLTHAVTYAIVGGTAESGADYQALAPAVLTFAPSTLATVTQPVEVLTIQDSLSEPSETVILGLSAATNGAAIADAQGEGAASITDSDGPEFSVADVQAPEGQDLVFRVTKTGATVQTHNVSYSTSNGTATTSDYGAVSGTLTFQPSQTYLDVPVTTVNDTTPESHETIFFNIGSPTNNATISDAQGQGTIINNDNHAPIAIGATISGYGVTGPVSGSTQLYDSDEDGDTLSIVSVTQPALGTASYSNSSNGMMVVRYDGYMYFDGFADSFDYTITDGHGGYAAGHVDVVFMPWGG